MNYFIQQGDESPIFKGTYKECVEQLYYFNDAKIVSEAQLHIENN